MNVLLFVILLMELLATGLKNIFVIVISEKFYVPHDMPVISSMSRILGAMKFSLLM
jgi:hypothetical protein